MTEYLMDMADKSNELKELVEACRNETSEVEMRFTADAIKLGVSSVKMQISYLNDWLSEASIAIEAIESRIRQLREGNA